MLELERPLRLAWDVARLNFGEGQNAAGNPANPNGVNLAMCTEAINSDYFWSFLAMVDILAGVGNHLQRSQGRLKRSLRLKRGLALKRPWIARRER